MLCLLLAACCANALQTILSISGAAAAAAKSLQSCPTLCDPKDGSPPGSPIPGILQARVGCHFLLQCMKVKSESEVAQLHPTLRDPMDCSLPGSSIHGIFQARVLEWGAIAFSDQWSMALLFRNSTDFWTATKFHTYLSCESLVHFNVSFFSSKIDALHPHGDPNE